MSISIRIEDLTKTYFHFQGYRDLFFRPGKRKETIALNEVTFHVNKGELFSLLGPTGAGKTTLIKVLCNLVLPTSGQAFVNGLDVTKSGKQIRKSIGYVIGDERSFYWRLTGRQNLEFFAKLNNLNREQTKERVEAVLDLINMSRFAGDLFKNYSSGQKQKIAIARGLLADPDILILDEPTRSLDPTSAKNIRNFIRKEMVDKKGKTVFLATHNLTEAEELSDRLAILNTGAIKAMGSIEEIGKIITKKATFLLEAKFPPQHSPEQLLAQFAKDELTFSSTKKPDEIFSIKVILRETKVSIDQVITQIVNSGGQVYSCIPQKSSLLDVFESVTLNAE